MEPPRPPDRDPAPEPERVPAPSPGPVPQDATRTRLTPAPAGSRAIGLPRRALLATARGADGFYMAAVGALKFMGILPEADQAPEVARGDGRYAVLPPKGGRWPELRLQLPDGAVYAYSVESLFRRAALWRSWEPREDILRRLRATARDAWPEGVVEEAEHGGDVLVLRRAGGGRVTEQVRLSALPDGGTMIGLGQSILPGP